MPTADFYLSPNGRGHLKREEGLRLKAYRDVGGVWTIGYGHTGSAREGMVITDQAAENLLDKDIIDHAAPIFAAIGDAPTTRSQLDAFVIAAYNVGVPRFLAAGVVAAHKTGDTAAVQRAWARLPATVKGVPHPVLIRRRASELKRYLRVDDEYVLGGPQSRRPATSLVPELPLDGQPATPEPDKDAGQKPLSQSRTIGGGVIAGGAAVVSVVKETTGEIKVIQDNVSAIRAAIEGKLSMPFDVIMPVLLQGIALAGVLGAALAIYARFDDRRKGRN